MRTLAVVILAVALGLCAAPVATAQIGPNVPAPLTQPPPPPPAETPENDDEGLSLFQKILIFGSAALILALIGWLIVRDAHRSAPVEEHGPRTPDEKKARDRARQQEQRRARARAARRQRKKNRR